MPLPTFTGVDVLAWNPYCDECIFLPLDWSDDALAALNYVDAGVEDIHRLWVAARRTYLEDADIRTWIDDMIDLAISKMNKNVQICMREHCVRIVFLKDNSFLDANLRVTAFEVLNILCLIYEYRGLSTYDACTTTQKTELITIINT